jgi:hypothetical protein
MERPLSPFMFPVWYRFQITVPSAEWRCGAVGVSCQ